MIGYIGMNFGQQDQFSAVLSAVADFNRAAGLAAPTPVRTGSPLRINGYPEAKRAERRAKNKAARKARRHR